MFTYACITVCECVSFCVQCPSAISCSCFPLSPSDSLPSEPSNPFLPRPQPNVDASDGPPRAAAAVMWRQRGGAVTPEHPPSRDPLTPLQAGADTTCMGAASRPHRTPSGSHLSPTSPGGPWTPASPASWAPSLPGEPLDVRLLAGGSSHAGSSAPPPPEDPGPPCLGDDDPHRACSCAQCATPRVSTAFLLFFQRLRSLFFLCLSLTHLKRKRNRNLKRKHAHLNPHNPTRDRPSLPSPSDPPRTSLNLSRLRRLNGSSGGRFCASKAEEPEGGAREMQMCAQRRVIYPARPRALRASGFDRLEGK